MGVKLFNSFNSSYLLSSQMFDEFLFQEHSSCSDFAIQFTTNSTKQLDSVLRANGLDIIMKYNCAYQFRNPLRLSMEYLSDYPNSNVSLLVTPCCGGSCEVCRFKPDDPLLIFWYVFIAIACIAPFLWMCWRLVDWEQIFFINSNIRLCPHCGTAIQKVGGCNMVFCTACSRLSNWNQFRYPQSYSSRWSRFCLNPVNWFCFKRRHQPQPTTSRMNNAAPVDNNDTCGVTTRMNNRPVTISNNNLQSNALQKIDIWVRQNNNEYSKQSDSLEFSDTACAISSTRICQICETRPRQNHLAERGHSFCKQCILTMMSQEGQTNACPLYMIEL